MKFSYKVGYRIGIIIGKFIRLIRDFKEGVNYAKEK
ncbi:hypothetical protein phiCPE_00008 [Clostridium phage vB_CpeS-1181]|nr:hypothetical protein phiCPE_00008 [Clostridium phage vB_CpeS-1181]